MCSGRRENEGQVNWRDITSGSTFGEYAFSLGPGCYLAITTLYEQVDADHRAGNATALGESMQSLDLSVVLSLRR